MDRFVLTWVLQGWEVLPRWMDESAALWFTRIG